ncbi:MAG: ABC transporter permease [Pseudomonadota bacterium]
MAMFIVRRLGTMLLTILALTFVVFYLVNLPGNLEKIAKSEVNMRMTDQEVEQWLNDNGYGEPFLLRYGGWVLDTVQGDMGYSRVFRKDVSEVVGERLYYTGILMLCVMLVMVPGALIIGVLAGMREGSTLDRGLSVGSIATTSAPEYVTGIVFVAVFASALGLASGLSNTSKFDFERERIQFQVVDPDGDGTELFDRRTRVANARELVSEAYDKGFIGFFGNLSYQVGFVGREIGHYLYYFALPVITMAIYGLGYIARMTRASMAEVMMSNYIRTARLKGMPFRTVVLKHALRNALIAPFTVIMLQFPWLLTGVVIVETMFNYKGFGSALVDAAGNNDIELLLAISWIAVIVVLLTQLISDVGYAFLNPRIRVG